MSANDNAQTSPQAEASDPRRSAWVSANAGSGKTTVLVRRVIRLLLDDVPPGRILCLTYTKAAAAHMANEVLKKLSAWVRLDDEALNAAISEIEPGKPDAQRRARARRLFAAALETPGGLKVQTIHAFCDRVLHMFPVEAEAPAGFDVLDELGERDLIENARIETLLEAGNNRNSEIGRALRYCVESSGDEMIGKAIGECLRAKLHLVHSTQERISLSLALKPEDTLASLENEIFDGPNLARSEWAAVSQTLIALDGVAKRVGNRIAGALSGEPHQTASAYLEAFFKSDGAPREEKDFGSEKARKSNAALFARLLAECERAVSLRDRLRATYERERSRALLLIASEVIARYEHAKQRRGVLDFADLVTKTVALLEREKSAWVHYKLDGGIEHILVDEAQDTSPEQWRIVAKLAEEFFAGKGASDRPRSIFVVGDEKQSIFSFQGADPKHFDKMQKQFDRQLVAAGSVLNKPRLLKSYRSVDVVLKAIDSVFSPDRAREGLSASDDARPVHEAVRQNAPGTVEIWPALKALKESDGEDGWDKPLDKMRETSAKMRLAQQIARAVKHWTNGGLAVADRRKNETLRAVEPGDIIILVQSRGALFEAILRALKKERVDVAGADRLTLTENIAVMDMMALGDALLLASDDLSLACVLKSPLFQFGDSDLFALCHEREHTLWASLCEASSPAFADAAKLLVRWREQALRLRPFDFYSRVLGRDGGRKKMISRLGPEAADALDELLSAALAYEKMEPPSLQGFLRYLRRAEAEVKRDLDTESRLVRVMTVHGVKGLEAPVVVLADTTTLPHPTKEPQIVPLYAENEHGEDVSPLIWAANKDNSSKASLEAKARIRTLRLREYRRLLYVALTRSMDMLVVCGALNKNKEAAEEGSWFDLVQKSLGADSENITEHKVPYADEAVLRWSATELTNVPAAPAPQEHETQLAEWLNEAAPPRPSERTRLRPSFAQRGIPSASASTGSKARGILLHRLLQSLPEVATAERESAAGRYLSQAAPSLDEQAKKMLTREALQVIGDPALAEIFGPESQAEPELIARIPDGARKIEIPARLDRLVVSGNLVTFADFKSDSVVPASLAEIPEHYISQLAAYREALALTFPGRELRAILIFTATPRVFEIPTESLESAWQRLKTQVSFAFV
jgi:ATP-dependent helicase/nuclease subunit A